jgi:hypothetical protein
MSAADQVLDDVQVGGEIVEGVWRRRPVREGVV